MLGIWNFLIHLNSLPLWGLLFGVSSAGWGIRWHIIRMERAVMDLGTETLATVLEVNRGEADCVVTYSFTDEASGRTYRRRGIVPLSANPPKEGATVAVRYLDRNPGWSRLVDEVLLASI
jgi:hypothetical protein